jgi:uncharacterized protein Yka (UPF0111/DUF47 family)
MWWSRKKISFFDYFEQHSQEIRKAGITLKQLFEGTISTKEAYQKVKEYEHAADSIAHEVIKQLCVANFIPPLDHQDILGFIHALDDVIDFIEDTVEAFVEIFELKASTPFAQKFADEIIKGIALLVSLCPLLRSPARHSDAIQTICSKIHQLESVGDQLKKEALQGLFREYTGSKLDVAWERIYCSLEIITDKIQDCANISEQILMKYS